MTDYFLIGIKGSGMASLAQILFDLGSTVEGSDIDQYTFTQLPLEQKGIKIHPFSSSNIKEGQTVIVGNAFEDDHEEVVASKKLGLPLLTYPQVVEDIIQNYISIGVAGAHGKTSTTGLLVSILSENEDTSFLIGDGTGRGIKDGKYFVFEADEYRRHFADYTPNYAIITNIDFDHPDYFTDLDDVTSAFSDFANHVKKQIIAWGDDKQLRTLQSKNHKILFYGLDQQNDFYADNIIKSVDGSSFDIVHDNQIVGNFKTPLYGQHGVLNAMSAIIVAHLEGMNNQQIQDGLDQFHGVKRRFTQKQVADMVVIDDYAHHPSEITATLDAARQKFPDREIIAVFQPHTFSRVIAYKDQFAASLDLSDHVFLVDIFGSARESEGQITSEDLGKVTKKFVSIISENDLGSLLTYKNAVVVFMGAGDIGKYESRYEELLNYTRGTI